MPSNIPDIGGLHPIHGDMSQNRELQIKNDLILVVSYIEKEILFYLTIHLFREENQEFGFSILKRLGADQKFQLLKRAADELTGKDWDKDGTCQKIKNTIEARNKIAHGGSIAYNDDTDEIIFGANSNKPFGIKTDDAKEMLGTGFLDTMDEMKYIFSHSEPVMTHRQSGNGGYPDYF